ncbi:hypothetical protein ACOSP7_009357 [Xanthoceras sorbifolium]
MKKIALCLVGKLLSSKQPNCDAFRMIIPKTWRTSQEVVVENVKDNIFVFYFKKSRDRKRVSEGRPWSFDNGLLVLEALTGLSDFTDMDFRWVPFWVQVHNIPLICMTKNVRLLLSRHLGTVKELDMGATGDCVRKYVNYGGCA